MIVLGKVRSVFGTSNLDHLLHPVAVASLKPSQSQDHVFTRPIKTAINWYSIKGTQNCIYVVILTWQAMGSGWLSMEAKQLF